MKIDTMGLDIKIKSFVDNLFPRMILSNEDEKIHLEFDLHREGLEHTAEQFISALFDYDGTLAHKLYQEFGNVADLKAEINELKEEVESLNARFVELNDEQY